MLSIGKLGAGGVLYYTEGLGTVDEYYSEAGARTGVWLGTGAELLGLDGSVDPEMLGRVLDGRDPSGGLPLGGPRSTPKVPGFDLCFRAPKSVSLLQALSDPATAAAVMAAHRAAVGQALGYIEHEATWVRRGHAGAERLPGAGLVGAGFEHFTSRAGDPHLHTHVVVANLSRGSDGRWSALDGRALYQQAKTAGYLYEAVLRHELTRSLGIEWGPVVNGIADVAGVPRSVIDGFSRRRAQIQAELALQGASSPKAAQVATLTTRPAKELSESLEGLRAEWRSRAAELGVEPALWVGLAGPSRQPVALDHQAVSDGLLSVEGLTANRSSFDRRDVIQAIAQSAAEGAIAAEVEAMADQVLADGRVVEVSPGPQGRRWSTLELVELERHLVDTSMGRRASGAGAVEPRLVETLMSLKPSLSGEQRAMVEALCRSGDGVHVVIGVAGAGKTYALGAAAEAWRAGGRRVIGTALSARAAQELSDGAGIHSQTIARLLGELADRQRGGLARDSVLVVDEAAMAGTRDLAALAGHAQRAGAKLVLVGDDRQLPAIAAGGVFTALAEKLGAVELVENRRQALGWERAALAQLRAGQVTTALAAYHLNDRRHHAATIDALSERLVADWGAARAGGTQAMMLATRRADVDRLNAMARDQLRQAGQLGPDLLDAGGHVFALGDQIICTRNDRHVGVINGTRATVAGIGADRGGLTVELADGRHIDLPAIYLEAGNVAHGYATTIHKAQGATTERTFILADAHLYQEAGYVSLSRGRYRNDLYTTELHHDHEGHGPARRERDDPLAWALGRSRAQQPAGPSPTMPGRSIADLEHQRRRLAQDLDRPGAWQQGQRLEQLIAQRTNALGLWALEHPEPEHDHLLGEPPRQPERRAEWVRAAGEISAYQERHGVAYQPGLEPEFGAQWYDHHRLNTITQEVAHNLDRSHEFELGHDRGLGLGL